MTRTPRLNPFYALVVLIGVTFVVTTLAYVVAWVRLQQSAETYRAAAELGPVLRFVNDRGEQLLLGEAILLAIFALWAMGLDRWRARQANSDSE